MNHKHADLIKAWADGAKIQYLGYDVEGEKRVWLNCDTTPNWYTDFEYRIKPEPKPDVIDYACVSNHAINNFMPQIEWTVKKWANLKFIWDGETGKLKTVEVIK